jgi:hypothetical protein
MDTSEFGDKLRFSERVVFADNSFIVTGEHATILTSPDGVSWASKNTGVTNDLRGLAYGNNSFVVVGAGGSIIQTAFASSIIQITPSSLYCGYVPPGSYKDLTLEVKNIGGRY